MWITYKGLFSSEFSKDNKKTSLIRSMFTVNFILLLILL